MALTEALVRRRGFGGLSRRRGGLTSPTADHTHGDLCGDGPTRPRMALLPEAARSRAVAVALTIFGGSVAMMSALLAVGLRGNGRVCGVIDVARAYRTQSRRRRGRADDDVDRA